MKVVLQDGIKDCGVCALLSIIRFYGGDVPKEYLRELTNTTKSGVSAYKLIEAAKEIGIDAIGMTGELEKIDNNNLPCIAHVIINKKYQHFIVIYEIDEKKRKLLIMDPAKGKRMISFSEYKLMSSNNYIFFHPHKTLPSISNKQILKKTIKKFIKDNKKLIPFISILTFTYFIFNIVTAFHFKYLMEYAINYNIDNNVLEISIIVLFIHILKEITTFMKNILLVKWSEMFDEEITGTVYEQIILLPYLYYKNRTTGEVISRIKDLSIIKDFLSKLIATVTTDIITVVIFIIIMFTLNKTLTLLSITISLMFFLINLVIRNIKGKKLKKYYKYEDKINSYLIETLASVDAVKGIHVENDIINNFKSKYKKYLESIYDISKIESLELFFKNIITNIIIVIIFGMGTKLVINNKLSIEELIIYQSILNYYFYSIINIFTLQKEFHNFKLSLNRIEDLFTIFKENFEGSNYYNLCVLNGDIKYCELTYSYNSHKLFDKLNLTIKQGEKVLLCGPSGSGKSTLVKLLMRYIEIPFGSIMINNIDINHYHLNNLRNRITYISQQEFLFSSSIYNNIVMNRDIKEEELEKVAKVTLVNKIIEKEQLKYQKLIEENGFNFSGGERQRIILARSLLKDSDIYILDEALNQIDIENERKILNNIFKYLKNKTIIVISHRFNNQELFDRVIKINKGKIDEIKV